MNNFVNNNLMDMFHLRFNNKYQLVIKYGLIKYGLPKSTILLILLFL